MQKVRQSIGGLGNLLFKEAFLLGQVFDGKLTDSYVQDYWYWIRHADKIKERFGQDIGETDKVAIHIRRGDYLAAHNFHVDLCGTAYYQVATQMFPNESFLVFCKDNQGRDDEDRKWVEKFISSFIPKDRWDFASLENDEVTDLNLMASCKALIMANSTFSWWAAFLGKAQVVITPDKWFVDGIERTKLLPEWTRI